MTSITLTWAEIMLAGQVGTMRSVSSRKQGLNRVVHNVKSNWSNDFDGAAAEMAYAKYRNVYYEPSINTFKAPDVTQDQIRSTLHPNGKLLIRENDVLEERFILVICSSPIYRMAGWLWTSEAKKDEWFRPADDTGVAAWWVPQNALHSMETL